MAVNFTKNQEEITNAWREVVDSKQKQCWALFGYEGNTNIIKLMSTGSNGLNELVQELNCSLIQYAFCRVVDKDQNLNKLVLINWQGDSAPLSRKGLCASHVGDVANYFKGSTQTITIRNDDEATQEYLMDQILKQTSSSRVNLPRSSIDATLSAEAATSTAAESATVTKNTKIGSSYKKTDINSEIPVDRKSFWQRQEEEEKERLEEEKKRAAEKQAQFERERKAREETEAKKLAEAIKERDRLIEATRQADRRESSGSQPSSIISSNANQDNDDERVGRRSELIRLERNQETQSLISKGLIKNKRAIFEQASQQSQQSAANTMTRRPSGSVVSQRLNTFKSLDSGSISGSAGSSNSTSVEKLTNGFVKQVSVSSTNEDANKVTVKKQVEAIKITDDGGDQGFVSSSDPTNDDINNTASAPTDVIEPPPSPKTVPPPQVDHEVEIVKAEPVTAATITASKEAPSENDIGFEVDTNAPVAKSNGDSVVKESNGDSIVDSNGNSNLKLSKSPKQEQKMVEASQVIMNGKSGIMAKALYDYQAADNTEISFDPDDIIGKIEKVDPGWWHGSVMTGQHKGQCGLFPANYVEELP